MPKHIFLFSDGTWTSPEIETPTNVCLLSTMLSLRNSEGEPQIVYYDPGIGSDGDIFDQVRGGMIGAGIDLNIQQLYTFLAMNYEEGDSIYLFGFSRGAYTVRSLAGMIFEAGLVTRENLGQVKEAYDLYRDNKDPNSDTAKEFRRKYGREVKIKLLACFDTVGALGIPVDAVPFGLGKIFIDSEKYKFHDTALHKDVEHGIHILSVDETRKGFLPTYMDPHPERGPEQVTQVFMPGHHSGIGGGDTYEKPFADNALLFMLRDMEKRGIGVGFRKDMFPREHDPFLVPWKETKRYWMFKLLSGEQCRDIESCDMLHESVFKRYQRIEEWRPASLKKFVNELKNH